jgi:autotransporter strand-loop-strand O-heptosyltransferase
MKDIKIYGHGSYIGTTGYNNHTRDFFRGLSKHCKIKFRNFTVGKSWSGMENDEPHEGESYLNNTDREILNRQTVLVDNNLRKDVPIYEKYGKDFKHDLNIVLSETNHHYFYDNYMGPKIAYNVWESTLQPQGYFNQLLGYDELWVPSEWQKECSIKQGFNEERVKVVPEGVDVDTFFPEEVDVLDEYKDGRFKFLLFGRWDYRKSTKEIIQSFLKTFDKDEPVDLIVSIDNMWGEQMDGFKTTEERLSHYNLLDDRIKILSFPKREDYIKFLKTGHVFLSCARSEGWNLPLIEAMACGTPSIYSNCSGQLQFAKGRGIPVNIINEKPANINDYARYTMSDLPGNYYEPDFNHLSEVMRDVYTNYKSYKDKSLRESTDIRSEFNWDRVAEIGLDTINDFLSRKPWLDRPVRENVINVSYINKPKVEILGEVDEQYNVEFIDGDTNEVIHSTTIGRNMWCECSREYYTNWIIKINGEIYDRFDVTEKRVLIYLDSSSIGDTIAWTPYAVEFAKKHNCKVVLSTFHNNWFKGNPEYSDIEFINPGESTPCYTSYKIGWFRNNDTNKWDNLSLNPVPPNTQELQKTATDILGLDFKELNLGIDFTPSEKPPYISEYVVICPESTAGCKEWTYDSWVKLSEMLRELGYSVVTLTKKKYNIKGNINIYNRNLNESINLLYHAKFMVGISSGLSWLNWSLKKHTFLISGFTPKHHEFTTNVTRIINEHACNSCWSNTNFSFDAGDWDWCPIWKGTDKQHICQKSISPISVYKEIQNYLK